MRTSVLMLLVDRLMWFKLILDDDQKSLTEEELHELILLYPFCCRAPL